MCNSGADFVQADAATVGLERKFDIIFAKDLIEHIPNDEAFLQNMADHLRDDDCLVLTTQDSLSLDYYIDEGYNLLVGSAGWCGYDPTHLRFYNFRRLNRKLRKAGLIPLRYWSIYHFP